MRCSKIKIVPNVTRRENQTTEYYDIEAIEERVYGLSENLIGRSRRWPKERRVRFC